MKQMTFMLRKRRTTSFSYPFISQVNNRSLYDSLFAKVYFKPVATKITASICKPLDEANGKKLYRDENMKTVFKAVEDYIDNV